jgi:hypothetical protein
MVGSFTKQPAEAFNVTVDFNARLASGEGITSETVAATLVSTGATATSTVITSASVSEAAGVVTIPVKAGTDGQDYRIKVTVVTDGAVPATHEADLLMRVREW